MKVTKVIILSNMYKCYLCYAACAGMLMSPPGVLIIIIIAAVVPKVKYLPWTARIQLKIHFSPEHNIKLLHVNENSFWQVGPLEEASAKICLYYYLDLSCMHAGIYVSMCVQWWEWELIKKIPWKTYTQWEVEVALWPFNKVEYDPWGTHGANLRPGISYLKTPRNSPFIPVYEWASFLMFLLRARTMHI